MRKAATVLLSLAALHTAPAAAQDSAVLAEAGAIEAEEGSPPVRHAIGTDFFLSTDADDTDVYRAGVNLDVNYRGQEQYWGVRLEKARYKPLGQKATGHERGYLRYADRSGAWAWKGQIGTDGHTVLGSASVHRDSPFRPEFFVERDIVETPRGVDEGLYYTFVGAAADLPVDDRNSFTVLAGAQEFTGKNVRLHLRANYTHALKPEWGLSAQLRTRYFHSTEPREYDYYSPRWYAQVVPVLQLRRYSGGWRYKLAGGIGVQRDSASDWRSSRYFAAEVISPEVNRSWFLKADLQYSNTPLRTGAYDYLQFSVALTKSF